MFKLFNLKVILAIAFYAIVTLSYNYYNYNKYKKEEISKIDEKLKLAAYTVYDLLGKEFFLKATNKDSISKEEDWKNIRLLSSYNNNAKLAFIFASIKKDGKVYLISSSATSEEIENNEAVFYFYDYKSAKKLVEVFEGDEILYETYSDKWGTFKSIHIPITLENKHKFVVSAEIPLDSFNKLLNEIKDKYFLEAFLYLLITIPIILAVYFNIKEKVTIEEKLKNELYKKDIEEKKQKHLVHQNKMAAMGEMIENIAHQWRQPLSLITISIAGMKIDKELGLLDDETFNKNCDAINDNAQHLSQTIDDFRNFITGNRFRTVFGLTKAINSFLHLTEGSIKNNYITTILDLDDSIKINGYENELTQCFINIFNNAKDTLVEKEIKNKLIFIDTKITENNAIIKIRDNGTGIPEDIIDKIFEPYFTTKHESQGTGLGLHMTYNLIVDGMNGTIKANNISYEYEKKGYFGAEFTITLPLS